MAGLETCPAHDPAMQPLFKFIGNYSPRFREAFRHY